MAIGQRVDQGAMIGTLGDSANASGPHLHFEEKVGRSVVPAWFAGIQWRSGALTSKNCVDVPLAGKFAGDRVSEVAVFRRGKKSSFVVNLGGATPLTVTFGKAYDEPLLADWNGDGQLDVGVRTPKRSTFRLKTPTGIVKLTWGVPSDMPISGDRDGNGTTEIGVLDQATATFTLRTVNAAGLSQLEIVPFGAAGHLPVTGDWNGDGVTDLAVWTPTTAVFTQGVARAPMAARDGVRHVRWGNPRP